ncbi:hypothetical protein ACMGDM_01950 [Sphingomonas sp. DT-51]|uniref:hypothetical protein n=1 Tax=Sphingomonas sp. DT-51 TaxID=3396165 RepID=UPI003F1B1FE9
MQTERITFLTIPHHKAAFDAFAARSGMSVGHVVREAISRYIAQERDKEAELAALVEEANIAAPKWCASIDHMIDTLQGTHEHVDRTLRPMGARS